MITFQTLTFENCRYKYTECNLFQFSSSLNDSASMRKKTAATTKNSSYWLRAKCTWSSFPEKLPAAGAFCQYGDTIRKKQRTFRPSAVQQGWARPPPLSPPPLAAPPAPPGSHLRRLFSGPLNSAEFLRSSEVSRRLGRRRHRCLLC